MNLKYKSENIINNVFGKLTVISVISVYEEKRQGMTRWAICICECGNSKKARLNTLMNGDVLSCGCIKKAQRIKHNLSKHPLYKIFYGMKERCNNPNHDSYPRYGGRGIKICVEWSNNFNSFYTWATRNNWQKGLKIDRINNNLGYSPINCRIVTNKINNRNKENNFYIEYNGEIKTITEWAEIYEMPCQTLRNRLLRAKMTFEKAISTKKNYYGCKNQENRQRNALGRFCKSVSSVHAY